MSADFSRVLQTIADGVVKHADAEGLTGVKRAVFIDRGQHAPGEKCALVCDPMKTSTMSPVPHDYEEIGEEYGSLADGGDYGILECKVCHRVAYYPLSD